MLVTFDRVHLRYGTNRPVLTDINLSLAPRSFHFLTGPSGAGKSSLLRLIYRAERATEGRIDVFGKDVAQLSPDATQAMRRRLGVVFQDFRLIHHLTALENTALPLRLANASRSEALAHAAEMLVWAGLGDRIHALPHELSGGEQQRVAIARAVVNKPSLLLADEPTGNVDEASAVKLMYLFAELHKMGTAILLATHQKDLIARLGFPAMQLDRGRLSRPLPEAA